MRAYGAIARRDHTCEQPRGGPRRGSRGRNGRACRQGYTRRARRGPKRRDQQQADADDRDTVYGHMMCSWRPLKLLIKKMLLQLRILFCHIWRDMPASIDSTNASNTGVTIDTGRCGTANVTDLDAYPAVESTRIGGVPGFETVRDGPRRAMALPLAGRSRRPR